MSLLYVRFPFPKAPFLACDGLMVNSDFILLRFRCLQLKRFIFFSKSMHDELPRMRHQLANLLVSKGHEVVFFQKPSYFFMRSEKKGRAELYGGLDVRRTKQLVHHQLRLFPWLAKLNEVYEKKNILQACQDVDADNVIVNFNYDYGFLRTVFKKNKIITIINDDFIAQARFYGEGRVRKALQGTVDASDTVLTVSYPLVRQLSEWCDPVLFLPWADSRYIPPAADTWKRDSVLIWASINNVIDYKLLDRISLKLPEVNFFLVGPLAKNVAVVVRELSARRGNIRYLPPANLEELPLGRFFAGLMPYKAGVKSTEAVTLANKSFRLLSKGLPLVVHGMPDFYKHPVIKKSEGADEMVKCLIDFQSSFWDVQDAIKVFVHQNVAETRYKQFMNTLNLGED